MVLGWNFWPNDPIKPDYRLVPIIRSYLHFHWRTYAEKSDIISHSYFAYPENSFNDVNKQKLDLHESRVIADQTRHGELLVETKEINHFALENKKSGDYCYTGWYMKKEKGPSFREQFRLQGSKQNN